MRDWSKALPWRSKNKTAAEKEVEGRTFMYNSIGVLGIFGSALCLAGVWYLFYP